jgi:hypothetical protein
MKKYFLHSIALLFAVVAASCTAPSDPAQHPASASDYFFPDNDNTLHYTYSQDSASVAVTATYRMKVDSFAYGNFSQLIRQDQAASASQVLFYFKNELSTDGSVVCILSTKQGDPGFIALKGNLDLGSTWYADPSQTVSATVVGKYAEYYLPGRQVHYTDVVVIKYADKTGSADQYIIRYFARGYGLILERKVEISSETADLQLLSRQGGSSGAHPDPNHDRWYNANGRYSAHPQDDLEDK